MAKPSRRHSNLNGVIRGVSPLMLNVSRQACQARRNATKTNHPRNNMFFLGWVTAKAKVYSSGSWILKPLKARVSGTWVEKIIKVFI